MARGPSGRIVVELEPALKRQLYTALSLDGITFKDWVTSEANRYIADQRQPQLLAAEPIPRTYFARSEKAGG